MYAKTIVATILLWSANQSFAADPLLLDTSVVPPKVLGCSVPFPLSDSFGQCVLNEGYSQGQAAAATAATALNNTIGELQDDIESLNNKNDEMLAEFLRLNLVNPSQLQNLQLPQLAALVADYYSQTVVNPFAAALNLVPMETLNSCLVGKGTSISALLNGAATDPVAFGRDTLVDMWATGIGSVQTLVGDPTQFGSANGRPMNTRRLIRRAESITGRLAAQSPVTACLWSLSGPSRNQIRQVAIQIEPQIREQYQAAIDNVVKPAVDRAMVELLAPMIREFRARSSSAVRQGRKQAARNGGAAVRGAARLAAAQVPEYARNIALSVAQDYILNSRRMQEIKSEIELLASAVNRGDQSRARTQLANVERQMRALTTFSDKAAVEVAIETMRRYGHALIDANGKEIVDKGFTAVQAVKNLIINVVTGSVSLAWEPASAIGESVSGTIGFLLDVSQPAMRIAMIALAHSSLDGVMEQAKQAIRSGNAPSDYATQAGPFAPLLREFPTEKELLAYVSPEFERIRKDLFAYHSAVLNLSRAAVNPKTKEDVRTPRKGTPRPGRK